MINQFTNSMRRIQPIQIQNLKKKKELKPHKAGITGEKHQKENINKNAFI